MAASVLLAAPLLAQACTTDAECSDGNGCNGYEACYAGSCVAGYPPSCGDGNPNTVEWCDPLIGCVFQRISSFTRCEAGVAAFAWYDAKGRCGCDESTTHGQYVRCVMRAAAEFGAGTLPAGCRADLKRCAARSTCGKPPGFVTCCVALPGVCDAGRCRDGVTPCASAQDCPQRSRCSLEPSTERCRARGGSPTSGSCCDAVCSYP